MSRTNSEKCFGVEKVLVLCKFSTGDEVSRLVNLVMKNASIANFSLVARETIIVSP